MIDNIHVSLTLRTVDFASFEHLLTQAASHTNKCGLFTQVKFENVAHARIGVESTLQANRIPYDKHWVPACGGAGGREYCRVNLKGATTASQFNDEKIQPSTFTDGLKEGNGNGVEACFNGLMGHEYVTPWPEQIKIMQKRDNSRAALLKLPENELEALVEEFAEAIASARSSNTFYDVAAALFALDVNDQGVEAQVRFLLDNGYSHPEQHLHSDHPAILGSCKRVTNSAS